MTFSSLLDHVADVYRLTESKGEDFGETVKSYSIPSGGADRDCTFTRRDTVIGGTEGGQRKVGDRTMFFETGFDFQDRDVIYVKSGPTGFQGPVLLEVESIAVPRGHHVELRVVEFEGTIEEGS